MKNFKFRANDTAYNLACEQKIGGLLFHLGELDHKPIKRLLDQDNIGAMIFEIKNQCQLTVDMTILKIEPADQAPLVQFLERFK